MEEVYLNELSLDGQYNTPEEFLEACIPFMRCLKTVKELNKWRITKHSEFYKCKITKRECFNDLRGMRGDAARRLKSLLLSTAESPPFWDMNEEFHQDLNCNYYIENHNVSATSAAEAAEAESFLLSFDKEFYCDRELEVNCDNGKKFPVPSVVSGKYLADVLWARDEIDVKQYLLMRYEGTRLDFSLLEEGYGFEDFEKREIQDCLREFERFIALEDWNAVFADRSLHYKQYTPSVSSENWFRNSTYCDKTIDKFRCVNPKRCFGYKEGEVFYVLRMERDHRISDKG